MDSNPFIQIIGGFAESWRGRQSALSHNRDNGELIDLTFVTVWIYMGQSEHFIKNLRGRQWKVGPGWRMEAVNASICMRQSENTTSIDFDYRKTPMVFPIPDLCSSMFPPSKKGTRYHFHFHGFVILNTTITSAVW